MSIDHKAFLALAMRDLERFSIPAVGTFVREIRTAQLDSSKKLVQPPMGVVRVEAGERYVPVLYDYLTSKAGLVRAEAEKYVAELSHYITEYLKIDSGLDIAGVGRLLRKGGALAFEPTLDDPTLRSYGLEPVGYLAPQIAEAAEVKATKDGKGKVVPKGRDAKQTAKSKAKGKTKSKGKAQPEPSDEDKLAQLQKTKRQILYVAGAFIVLVLIVLVLFFEDIGHALKLPFFRDLKRKQTTEAKTTDPKATPAQADTTQKETKQPEAGTAVDTPDTTRTEIDPNSLPNAAQYSIIAEGYEYANDAETKAREWASRGYKGTSVARGRAPRFVVVVFATANKREVVKKLKDIQKIYPKAYINTK